jgi:HSP20 family protein
MALVRWEPFGGLTSLRRDMNRLFEDFMERVPSHVGDGTTEPAVEVSDTPEAVVVKAQMPGVSKDHIHVDVSDDVLTLKGEMKEEKTKEEKNYYRREFRYGTFARSIPLPATVQSDQATAQLKEGILEVRIPKSEKSKAKQIPIRT